MAGEFLDVLLFSLELHFANHLVVVFGVLINIGSRFRVCFQVSCLVIFIRHRIMFLIESIPRRSQNLLGMMMMFTVVMLVMSPLLIRLLDHILNERVGRQQ